MQTRNEWKSCETEIFEREKKEKKKEKKEQKEKVELRFPST